MVRAGHSVGGRLWQVNQPTLQLVRCVQLHSKFRSANCREFRAKSIDRLRVGDREKHDSRRAFIAAADWIENNHKLRPINGTQGRRDQQLPARQRRLANHFEAAGQRQGCCCRCQ